LKIPHVLILAIFIVFPGSMAAKKKVEGLAFSQHDIKRLEDKTKEFIKTFYIKQDPEWHDRFLSVHAMTLDAALFALIFKDNPDPKTFKIKIGKKIQELNKQGVKCWNSKFEADGFCIISGRDINLVAKTLFNVEVPTVPWPNTYLFVAYEIEGTGYGDIGILTVWQDELPDPHQYLPHGWMIILIEGFYK